MSTKIYDGMIATHPRVMELNRDIRAVLEPMFYAKYVKAVEYAEANVGTQFSTLFGYASLDNREEWDKPIEAGFRNPERVWRAIIELQNTKTHTFSDLDFGYEVNILPNGRGIQLPPLVLLFSEGGGNEYRQALVDAGLVSEYGYWDNTDRPDEITSAQWRKRKLAWNGGWWAPAEVALTIEQTPEVNMLYRLVSERAEQRNL